MSKVVDYLKKVFGVDLLEKDLREKIQDFEKANAKLAEDAIQKVEPVVLSVKEQATVDKKPYIAVEKTHVNPDNIRTGFFELDWNEYFVLQLKEAGYPGSSDEEVVDGWFQELCRNIGEESGVNMEERGRGYVNIHNIGNGRSEIG